MGFNLRMTYQYSHFDFISNELHSDTRRHAPNVTVTPLPGQTLSNVRHFQYRPPGGARRMWSIVRVPRN